MKIPPSYPMSIFKLLNIVIKEEGSEEEERWCPRGGNPLTAPHYIMSQGDIKLKP